MLKEKIEKWVKGKGEPGRIHFMKTKELLTALLLFAICVIIFMTGLILNDWSKGNVFTIIAAVGIIPVARALTGFILVFPFKSVDQESIKRVEQAAKPGSIIYTDVIVTSTEKAMGAGFIVVTASKILVLKGREKENALKLQEYLQDFVKRKGYDYKVTVAEDLTRFITLLKSSDSVSDIDFGSDEAKENFDKDRQAMCELLESLMV